MVAGQMETSLGSLGFAPTGAPEGAGWPSRTASALEWGSLGAGFAWSCLRPERDRGSSPPTREESGWEFLPVTPFVCAATYQKPNLEEDRKGRDSWETLGPRTAAGLPPHAPLDNRVLGPALGDRHRLLAGERC